MVLKISCFGVSLRGFAQSPFSALETTSGSSGPCRAVCCTGINTFKFIFTLVLGSVWITFACWACSTQKSVFSSAVINWKRVPLKRSSTISDEFSNHAVHSLPSLLIEFPHYCIIALKMALGYVMFCGSVHFIFCWLAPRPARRCPSRVPACLCNLDLLDKQLWFFGATFPILRSTFGAIRKWINHTSYRFMI